MDADDNDFMCFAWSVCLGMQERTARLSSERDAALFKLKETEENVCILQQAVEVHNEMLMLLRLAVNIGLY